jgi:hypothetical protein
MSISWQLFGVNHCGYSYLIAYLEINSMDKM